MKPLRMSLRHRVSPASSWGCSSCFEFSRLQSQSTKHGHAETIRRSGDLNRQDLFMVRVVSVDCSGNEPDQSGRRGGVREGTYSLAFSAASRKYSGKFQGGQVRLGVVEVVAGLASFRCTYGQVSSQVGQAACDERGVVAGTVNNPHCAQDSTRPVDYIVAQCRRATEWRPASPRSPTGTCSRAMSRGADLQYFPNG